MTGFRPPRAPNLKSLPAEEFREAGEYFSALNDELEYLNATLFAIAANPWGYHRGGLTGQRLYNLGVSAGTGTSLQIQHALVTAPGLALVTPQASVGPFYVSVGPTNLDIHWAVSASTPVQWSWEAAI